MPNPPPNSQHTSTRAYRLLLLVVLLRPFGNLSLAWGMKHLPPVISISPLPYVLAMMNPFVGGGILLLVLSLLIRMALLSVADLSYVVPMTASGYILSTILGKMFLQESVSWEGWIGTTLVFLGSSLVSLTPGKTTVATKNQ